MQKIQKDQAAIDYFRHAFEFHKANDSSGEEEGENPLTYVRSYNVIQADYPQRIKNMLTIFAKDLDHQSKSSSDIYPFESISTEVKKITHFVFFEDEFNTKESSVKKINYLTSCLPQLKIELFPYETTRLTSVRVKDFLKLLKKVNINFDNLEEAKAVDELINKAQELKIPVFDRIYFTLSNAISLEEYDNPKASMVAELPNKLEADHYYLTYKNKYWQVYYSSNECKLEEIQTSRVKGLNQFLSDLPIREDYKYSYNETSPLDDLFKRFRLLKPLGFFKDYQRLISSFIEAKTLDDAKLYAEKLQQFREQYKMHFTYHNSRICSDAHLHEYKKSHNGSPPKSDERYFGSVVGERIAWKSFTSIFADPLGATAGKQKLIPWDQLLSFANIDQTRIIAKTLWQLGVVKDARLIQMFPYKDILQLCARDSDTRQITYLEDDLEKYSVSVDLDVDIKRYIGQNHILVTTMFDNPQLSFEDAFKEFFDKNLPVLITPDKGFNSDNPAVHFLLAKFLQIIKTGNPEDQAVVKGFFLGRDDKRDLNYLQTEFGRSTLEYESPYVQFYIEQKYKNESFDFFNQQEQIDLNHRGHFYVYKIPAETYVKIFRLPFDKITLECVKQLLPLFEENQISFKATIIEAHIKQQSPPYLLLSDEAVLLTKMIEDGRWSFPHVRTVLNSFTWPDVSDPGLEKISAANMIYLYRMHNEFLSFASFEKQQYLGSLIIEKLSSLTVSVDERLALIESLLFVSKKHFQLAISDVMFKTNLVKMYISDLLAKYGKDDNSDNYFQLLTTLIKKIYQNTPSRDVTFILSQLANAIESQERISKKIGELIEPEKYFNKQNRHMMDAAISSLAGITRYFSKNPEDQSKFLDFLSSPINKTDTLSFAKYLIDHRKANQIAELLGHKYTSISEDKKMATTEAMLQVIYHMFWDCSLQVRAVLIDYLLIPADKVVDEKEATIAYEKGFQYAAKKLFPKLNDPSSDDNLAYHFLKSYLNAADSYARPYLLAGMLVASNESQGRGQKTNVGKKLALLCEHMGPAYVKLAQAIHSHPSTPTYIKKDLDHIKGRANPPHRWELFRLINEVLQPADKEKLVSVGKLLGSASYNLAMQVTTNVSKDIVLLLLRENAAKNASQGFTHLTTAISNCNHPKVSSAKNTIVSMIDEASALSKIEMDKELSHKQSNIAAKLYNTQFNFELEGKAFALHLYPSQIIINGQGYRFIDLMHGTEFNELTAETADDKLIRRAVARVIMLTELINILRGGYFDCDRHGNQLRVYKHNNVIDTKKTYISVGLYDFGEMALEPPQNIELQQLKKIILGVPQALIKHTSLDVLISKHIDKALSEQQPTRYLMRIRKAFLALQDFQKHLSNTDLIQILKFATSDERIHPELREAFTSVMNKMNYMFKLYENIEYLRKNLNFLSHPKTSSCNSINEEIHERSDRVALYN